METVVLAFFKQENLYKTLLPAEKFENINLLQQTILFKIIYDFKIEVSFMEKWKLLVSQKLQIYIFNCNKCIRVRLYG